MVRIVFTADNHLNRYYAKMTLDQLSKRRQRLRDAFARTIDYAIEHHCHLYLHAGDLFDSPHPRTSELVWVARQFQRLKDAGVEILAIGGTHDVPKMRAEGATPQRIYDELRVARVFTKVTETEFVSFEIRGITIAVGGLSPDPRLAKEDDPLEGVNISPPEADVVFLLTHYGVEGTVHPRAEEPFLTKAAIARLDGIDYLLAGHVHRKANLQVANVTILIPGATERMTFGEANNSPGFWYLEFRKRPDVSRRGGVSTRPRYIKIDPQPMHRMEVRTTDLPPDDPTGYLFERIREVSHPDLLLQCRLEGPLPRQVYHRLRFFDVWRMGNELNFFFDLDKTGVYLEVEPHPPGEPFAERVSTRREIEGVVEAMLKEATSEKRELIEEAKELVLGRYYGR